MTRAKQLLTVYDLKSAECPFAKEIGKYISARKRSEQEAKKREALKHLSKEFKAGNKIYHKRFGLGTIKDVYGNMITVYFEKRGEKKLSINYLVENNLLEYE